MEWILVICTQGWVMCGQLKEVAHPSEASCYRAMEELYKRNRADKFKYVICEPRKADAAPKKGEG